MTGTIALVVAAGRGHRFGAALPKQYHRLAGHAVLRHSVSAFARHDRIGGVRVVIHADDRALYDAAVHGLALLDPVPGGASRQDSCRLGLESLESLAPERVLIHDGARPVVNAGLIDRIIDALDGAPAAIPALAVSDSLKRVADSRIVEAVDRAGLWRAQTPQGFRFPEILSAHRAAAGQDLTDDAAVAALAGLPVAVVEGAEDNIKITGEDDMRRAARALDAGLGSRTGTGFDVHAFGAGDHVMLCGVRIPHDHGLLGHSDADAGLHALVDAVFGALGAGDIGTHFPADDARWRGADSALFATRAREMVADAGGTITNLDVTLVCERPKVSPHRAAMVARLAELFGVAPARVNVKATTTESLGFTGRGEGLAAMAVATLRLPG